MWRAESNTHTHTQTPEKFSPASSSPDPPVNVHPNSAIRQLLDAGGGVVVGAAAFHGAGNLRERPGFGVDAGRVREGPEIILELAAVDR